MWKPVPGEVIANRFELLHELDRGGMASVWKALHTSLEAPCAIKFIDLAEGDREDRLERFKREARAAAKLRSRHVVQVFDYGVWKQAPYIAMELLEGETLADRLDREGQLKPEDTLFIFYGVARALSKAQELDIVHRDLKPENIFLVKDGKHFYTKVLDFGVAKFKTRHGRPTQTGAVVGTPHYMSPEQADGAKPVDHRSDLWSLAVLAFECLTGEMPFDSDGFGNLVVQIMHGAIPIPSLVNSALSEEFDAWWARATMRQPDLRFQSVEELFDGLTAALTADAEPGSPLAAWTDNALRDSWSTPPQQRPLLDALRKEQAAAEHADGGGAAKLATQKTVTDRPEPEDEDEADPKSEPPTSRSARLAQGQTDSGASSLTREPEYTLPASRWSSLWPLGLLGAAALVLGIVWLARSDGTSTETPQGVDSAPAGASSGVDPAPSASTSATPEAADSAPTIDTAATSDPTAGATAVSSTKPIPTVQAAPKPSADKPKPVPPPPKPPPPVPDPRPDPGF